VGVRERGLVGRARNRHQGIGYLPDMALPGGEQSGWRGLLALAVLAVAAVLLLVQSPSRRRWGLPGEEPEGPPPSSEPTLVAPARPDKPPHLDAPDPHATESSEFPVEPAPFVPQDAIAPEQSDDAGVPAVELVVLTSPDEPWTQGAYVSWLGRFGHAGKEGELLLDVPPGVSFEVSVSTGFHEVPVNVSVDSLGPLERRRVEVVFPPVRCELAGRLIAPNGVPVVECEFRVHAGEGKRRRVSRGRTDVLGDFRCPLAPGVRVDEEVLLELPDEAWACLRLTDTSGRIDVGPVRLAVLPVLVTGELRFPGGEPLAGALLRHGDWRTWTDHTGSFTLRGVADEPEIEVVVERWSPFVPVRVVPQAAGRVSLVGRSD
jgi:hypothetical protein